MLTILIVILIIVLLGAYPHAPWYGGNPPNWGYYPMGLVGLILIILLVLLLVGYPLPGWR